MKHYLTTMFALFLSLYSFGKVTGVEDLKCNHTINPKGITDTKPQLSWKLLSDENDQAQTAYEILIASDLKKLSPSKADLWNTGKVESSQSIGISYEGKELNSRQSCWWKVRVWDKNGKKSSWSEPARFEIGLLHKDDWKAEWMKTDIKFESYSYPSPLFRKEFNLNKDIKSARLYVTSLGLYEFYLNGQRVGDQYFTPGWTSFSNRILVQTYDVTKMLHKNGNAAGIMLGNGWYRAFWPNNREAAKINDLEILAQLEVVFTDGSTQTLITDANWQSSVGPVQRSEIYYGEVYDARLEQDGWNSYGFDASGWDGSLLSTGYNGILEAPDAPPVRITNELTPIEIIYTPEGDTVLDMGQNMVGRCRLKLNCPEGTTITLKHAEVLDKEGNFYTTNLRRADQEIIYTCRGGKEEIYEPYFTFQGFRYVKISGYPGEVTPDIITGIVLHSDIPVAGSFSCNNEMINQLQHNIIWGQKGNFLDVPTDCPQRDERLGWTGDAQAFAPTAVFLKDCAGFYTEWLKDLAHDQHADGAIPWVIPNVLGRGAAHGWADAGVIVPWVVYRYYGDEKILEQQYESMKAWVDYLENEAGETYLWQPTVERQFGDWLAFATTRSDYPGATTDKDLLATAYFYHSTNLLQKSAQVLGIKEDAEKYQQLMTKVKQAFNEEFVTPNGRLSSNTQTAYVVSLSFGLLPEELEETAAKRLADDVNKFGHITTGFLGTPDICHVLTKYGYLEEAYMLLYRKDYPSWLYPVSKGATTIWERWDGIKPDGSFQNPGMNSFNHYAYGAIGDWMYRKVAGIDLHPEIPGFKEFVIKPHPLMEMNDVKAEYESPYGNIRSEWRIENNKFKLQVTIPVNTKAKISIPATSSELLANGIQEEAVETQSGTPAYDYLVIEKGSGMYEFETEFKVESIQ